jgi:predicted secreted protein
MAALNGTNLLLYSGGKAVAIQRGLSAALNAALIDASNKESAGWWEGIPGLKDASIDFDALFSTGLMTDAPPVLGAKDLMSYLLSRTELLVSILDGGYPIIGKALQSSIKIDSPSEGAMTLSGGLKINGPLYILRDSVANLITDPDAGGTDYDTLTPSGLAIASAINAAGSAYCRSNVISVTTAGVYKLPVYLTLNSGQAPSVALYDNSSADISNVAPLVAGLNLITLTCTSTDASASLKFRNTAAANWALSPIYLFRVA